MALLQQAGATDSLGKRKREADKSLGNPLKKLALHAATRRPLTAFPLSSYIGQTFQSSPSSALKVNTVHIPVPSFASRPLVADFEQRSPIFHPKTIRPPPSEASNTAITLFKGSTRSTVGFSSLARSLVHRLTGADYRAARQQAQISRLQESLRMVKNQVTQLQQEVRASVEEKRDWYGDIVQKVRESAKLRRQVTESPSDSRDKKGKGKMLEHKEADLGPQQPSRAEERVEDEGEAAEGADRPANPSEPREGARVAAFLQRLHDLKLDDAKQRSRDLEIQLKEAELAVHKQQRLRAEEVVEEEEEVTEEEDEEEVTEEVIEEGGDETGDELEQEGYVAVPLTEEEDELVDQILDNPPSDDVCVAHQPSNLEITQAQMQCLRPDTWLNDEVINLYMVLLKERESREDFKEEGPHPTCHFFMTFFYNKLRMDAQQYEYKQVQRWTRRAKYKLAKCDKVIVPIHQGIHWALAVINLRDRRLEYFDSVCDGVGFPFSTKASPETVLEDLAQYISDESEDKGTGPIDTSEWDRVYHTDKPQQENNSDCGMFMIKFADFASRDAPITFSQRDMEYFRRKLVVELVHKRVD